MFVVGFVGNDGAFRVVEESVAVHVLEFIRTAALAETEDDGEGAGRIGTAFETDGIFDPAVIFPFSVFGLGIDFGGIDVFDLHLVERGAADGMRNADIGAPVSVHCGARFVLSAVVGHVERLDPNGEDGGSARFQSDGRRGGIFLCGSHSVGIGVVEHEDVVVFVRVFCIFRIVG